VHEWKLRTDPAYLREQVFLRDHGVCALCRVDTEALRKDKRKLDYAARRKFEKDWGDRRYLWDADHVVPVVEGGGECDLSNMRTLCLKCHREVTAALRKRRRREPRMDNTNFTLADTFLLNNRVTLQLLNKLSAEQLAWTANPRARSIGDQFAHMHNVRLMWLEVSAPKSAKALRKIGKGSVKKDGLRAALEESAAAMAALIGEAERSGKMKGYKRGVAAFFGYMMAHEGHHRGQIILLLKNAKMPIDRLAGFALWEWEKI